MHCGAKLDLVNVRAKVRIAILAECQQTTKLKYGFFLLTTPTPVELAALAKNQDTINLKLELDLPPLSASMTHAADCYGPRWPRPEVWTFDIQIRQFGGKVAWSQREIVRIGQRKATGL